MKGCDLTNRLYKLFQTDEPHCGKCTLGKLGMKFGNGYQWCNEDACS